MKNQPISALIFDFDGLILDTEGPIYQSWQETYAQHGLVLPLELWVTIIGTYDEPFDPWTYMQELAGKPLDGEAILPKRLERELELIYQNPIRPGVETYLSEAPRLGLKIGLASSSTCKWVKGHLQRLGLLAHFDCIRCKDDVQFTKPNPELYLAAAECLGVQAQACIALEDSPNGVTAAKAAGMFCVAAPNPLTHDLSLGHADLRLAELADLPLERLLELAASRKVA